ncbi:MAG: VIT1/CCC1 transporter family protein [Candidatus Latescibacterota bacterium]
MSLSRRIDEARQAFSRGDLRAAAAAHEPGRIAHGAREEHGGAGAAYIGEMVYGGLDGIITTFAVVSGVAGAKLGSGVVVILGVANLLADGFSMATGAYLSSKSQREYYDRERQREAWEVDHFPEGEKAELRELYLRQGYSEEDARQMVEIKSRDRERWVDAMMKEELGMLPDESHPLANGAATLASFVVAGSVPLLVYLYGIFVPVAQQVAFGVSVVLSALALFALGAARVVVTRQSPAKSGLEMLLVGGLAAVVAYGVGALLKGLGA